MKPVIAMSLGDPAGISPEVVAKSLDDALLTCELVVFGHWPSFERVLRQVSPSAEIELVASRGETMPLRPGRVTMVHCGPEGGPIDTPDRRAAQAQFDALERAVDHVLNGPGEVLVTGPVAKNLVAQVSPGFTGHTEYLASRAQVRSDDVTMVFASKELVVGLVSTHLPLQQVPAAVTHLNLTRSFQHVAAMLKLIHPGKKLRIGVAALNPHAGEDGLLGTEENQVIGPFCRALQQKGDPALQIHGPVPADTLFRDALSGAYDGIISAYHDQAMIPLKLSGVGQMVNVTMGLPFVRTSPDHGVAYDIAGRNQADPSGMKLAIDFAQKLANMKKFKPTRHRGVIDV
ncbi:MAG: 4-hydroxythreonine-4-phosphate dehydrogenase PdxA [Proteobacteria bacterium]|nr:4-hydroxythreonine-4-phosphate dehydrogenase PdxA [Pseudomonadota bacterium]